MHSLSLLLHYGLNYPPSHATYKLCLQHLAMSISPPKFHINIKIDPEYATTRSASHRVLRDAEEANRMRLEGKKHIDLWVDGSVYPRDPLNGRYPTFSSVHDLIRFVGDGVNGLLGYCLRLSQCGNEHNNQILYLNSVLLNSQNRVMCLQNQVTELQKKIKELENSHKQLAALKQTPIGLRERIRQLKNINNLLETSGGKEEKKETS